MALRGGAALRHLRDPLDDRFVTGPSIVSLPGTNVDVPHCPEVDCLRTTLSATLIAEAEKRAMRVGVGADRVLIAGGALSEETYLRALGEHLGVIFEPLESIPRSVCPVGDERLIESAAAGLLPIQPDGNLSLVVTPRGLAARRISAMIADNPQLARRFRFTSTERLSRFVLRCAGTTLATRAAGELKRTWPALSAAPPRRYGNIVLLAIFALVLLAAFRFAPSATLFALQVALATLFLASLGLRLLAALLVSGARDSNKDDADATLPVYTVIAALYREAASVDGLLSSIERLDYPAEKLDVILVLEADDKETHERIAARTNRLPVTVITAPASAPRTKPKALNMALPFARGSFSVIYDAEDRPEADQLRRALRKFREGGERVACVQARLCIDNTADSWLARFFTAEYAGQFDVFLPGIAALGLPVPLGGSSNHFRTVSLREVGGWDAYNVTEDADLGMRLARFGFRSDVISSTTFEEAPARLAPWLRQRTRWFKGWMQTWLVHMREPRQLMRNLGFSGFVGFHLVVGGNVLAALVHPLFMGGLIYSIASGAPMWRGDTTTANIAACLYGVTLITGYVTSAFLSWLGLMRRGLLASAWVLAVTPLHWLLLSLAAWRAAAQLLISPYLWEKTEHGLAKSSRRADRITHALVQLERHLGSLSQSDDLPAIGAKDTFATRRPFRRAAA